MPISIRKAVESDFETIWPTFRDIVAAGETYPYDPATTKEEGFAIWMTTPRATYVAEEDGEFLGTYYIKTNQPLLGAHVCNAGYMVSPAARGRGVATALCEHSQDEALRLGYKAMQFNLVVSTNQAGLHVWAKMGFERVGVLPRAFKHQVEGYVDAVVMYKWLGGE